MNAIRTIPDYLVSDIADIFEVQYPMFPGFLPKMIRKGVYVVVDESGKRLPTEQALKLVKCQQ